MRHSAVARGIGSVSVALLLVAAGATAALARGAPAPRTPSKYIITGGPGVGKTTLLNGLREASGTRFQIVPEAARKVIRREQARERLARIKGGSYAPVVPWQNDVAFQTKVFARQQRAETQAHQRAAKSGGDVLLDRSAIDGLAYLLNNGHSPLKNYSLFKRHIQHVRRAGYTKVLFLDPLPSYVNDRQRKESPAEAAKIHDKLFSVYKHLGDRYGFDVVRVPALPVPERIEHAKRLLTR